MVVKGGVLSLALQSRACVFREGVCGELVGWMIKRKRWIVEMEYMYSNFSLYI